MARSARDLPAGVLSGRGDTGVTEMDRRNADWYIDKGVQLAVFIGGISAIVFIIGIFVFITKEGFGFIVDTMDPAEFFLSEYWEPSDEDEPEYGILALIAGTASVTGLAMIVAIPFSLGAAIYISSSRPGRPGKCSRSSSRCSRRFRRSCGASSV